MYASKNRSSKNVLVLILIMLGAIVVGSFISETLVNIAKDVSSLSFLKFLGYNHEFGVNPPFSLNLIALTVQFGFNIKISLLSVLFMFLGVFIYRRM